VREVDNKGRGGMEITFFVYKTLLLIRLFRYCEKSLFNVTRIPYVMSVMMLNKSL